MKSRIWEFEQLKQLRGQFFTGELPTISEYFHHSCNNYPENIGFSCYGANEQHLNYRQIEEQVALVAGYLQHLGVATGDRVVFSGVNCISWAVVYLAVLELGAVVVPIDVKLPAERLLHLANFVEAKLLLADASYQKLAAEIEKSKLIRLNGEEGILALAANYAQPFQNPPLARCEDLAAIIFTSGTTGDEKGVMLTHKNFVFNATQATHPFYFSFYPEDILYLLLPMHHSYPMTGIFLESLFHGSNIVFPQGLALAQIIDDLSQSKITVLMSVPLFYNKILRSVWRQVRERGVIAYRILSALAKLSDLLQPLFGLGIGRLFFGFLLKKLHFKQMRIMISGGGPLASSVVSGFKQLGLCFIEGYGMSETSPIITLNPAENFKMGSVGKVLPLMEIKVVNPDKNGLGEIAVKGDNVCQGYYSNPSATAALFDQDGWLLTGDVGYLDDDNYLFLTGRSKLMIVNSAGKNIFPEEIENRFQLYQELLQIVVRSYRSSKLDEPIELLVLPDSDYFNSSSPEQVKTRLREIIIEVNRTLRSYERISRFWLLSEAPPLSSTAKVRRHLIAEQPEGAELVEL